VANQEEKLWLLLEREEWTKGPENPSAVEGLLWFTDGSRTAEGGRVGAVGKPYKEGSASL
jgi:hypothetical protein